jgi:hypothetical protein
LLPMPTFDDLLYERTHVGRLKGMLEGGQLVQYHSHGPHVALRHAAMRVLDCPPSQITTQKAPNHPTVQQRHCFEACLHELHRQHQHSLATSATVVTKALLCSISTALLHHWAASPPPSGCTSCSGRSLATGSRGCPLLWQQAGTCLTAPCSPQSPQASLGPVASHNDLVNHLLGITEHRWASLGISISTSISICRQFSSLGCLCPEHHVLVGTMPVAMMQVWGHAAGTVMDAS